MSESELESIILKEGEAEGYIEHDLMENDLKSFFRAFSSLGNWIIIWTEVALMDNVLMENALNGIGYAKQCFQTVSYKAYLPNLT